jgi:hypothetical protein
MATLPRASADRLCQLSKVRNLLIHGGLQVTVGSKDIKALVAVLKTLQGLL